MTILVTGGKGFIGRNLIPKLIKSGNEVICLDINKDPSLELEGVTYITGDVVDLYELKIPYFDLCYHLAAVHLDKTSSILNPALTFRTIVQGTEVVARFCKDRDAKVIYAGSSSKYFSTSRSPYTSYKVIAEEILRTYQNTYGLKLHIASIYNVYGYCTVTNKEISNLLYHWRDQIKKGTVEIFGDGKQKKDFVHVDDVTDALFLLSEHGTSFVNWHIGSGVSLSLLDIFNTFKKYFPKLKHKFKKIKGVDNSDHLIKDLSFMEEYAWVPKHSLRKYIKNTSKYLK